MLLYTLGDQASITGFIDFLGSVEPDQVVSSVLVGVLHSVIQAPRRKEQWADWVFFGLVWEADLLQDHQITYWVSVSFDRLESGVRCRLLLLLFIRLAHNQIVYLVNVWFLYIILPQILADGLINAIFFEVGHLLICFWALGAQISDSWHLWVGKGGCSFSHDGWLSAATVYCSELLLQLLHWSR